MKKQQSPVTVFLIIALLVFAVYYAYTAIVPAGSGISGRAQVTSGSLGDSYTGDALLVRNEVVYSDEGVSNIEYVAEEGAWASRGSSVCKVYTSGYSSKELATLQSYRDQIETYQLALLAAETTYDQKLSLLEDDVLQLALGVRNLVRGASGNMMNQEKLLDAAITTRQNYLRTKYATDQKMTRLYDDESAQQMKIDGWVKTYTNPYDAIVSFYADGYETGLNANTFEDFSPAQVRSMINGNAPEVSTAERGKTSLYRLVRDGSWYVLLLLRNTNWNPTVGETYQLMLEQYSTTRVEGTVLSYTRSGGELLVRLEIKNGVSDTLYMRSCSATIGQYVDAMCVPEKCIYTQGGMTGVVTETGSGQLFVPVTVISRQNGYAYIVTGMPEYVREGTTVLTF